MSESIVRQTLPRNQRITNSIVAITIVVTILVATWWMGERNGWAMIGSGGSNAQLLPKVGEPAPEFFTLREDGQEMELSQFLGQPVWLNFWGSWCAPCRAEMPEFIEAYNTLTPEGIVILPISINESPRAAIAYRDLVGGSFPVYIDPAFISSFIDADANPERAARFESMRNDWQIRNFPTHVFIDADGIVRQIILAQMTEEEMIESSMQLLNTQSLLPEVVLQRFD